MALLQIAKSREHREHRRLGVDTVAARGKRIAQGTEHRCRSLTRIVRTISPGSAGAKSLERPCKRVECSGFPFGIGLLFHV
jgi:hypothetical protein